MKLIKRMLRVATVLGAVGASLAIGASESHAGLGLRIDFGLDGFDITIQDGGAGDLSGALGKILQDFCNPADCTGTSLSNTGISKPISGSLSEPILDLSTLLQTSGATSIRIQLSDTDFDGALFGFGQLVSIGGTITGANGSVETKIYRDLNNAQFGTGAGTLICTTGPQAADAFDSFIGGCGALVSLDDEYSVTLETIITLDGAGLVSYDAITRLAKEGELDIPEPASIMLLGFGAMGLGAWKRRRKAQQN